MPYHQSVLPRRHARSTWSSPAGRPTCSACREVGELPSEARGYLDLVENQVGVPVRFVGTGPRRDQYVQFA